MKVIEKRKLFLSGLCAANYQLLMPDECSEEMTYFLKRSMLFYDRKMVYPRNKVYQDVITEYLDQNVNK